MPSSNFCNSKKMCFHLKWPSSDKGTEIGTNISHRKKVIMPGHSPDEIEQYSKFPRGLVMTLESCWEMKRFNEKDFSWLPIWRVIHTQDFTFSDKLIKFLKIQEKSYPLSLASQDYITVNVAGFSPNTPQKMEIQNLQ